MGAPLEPPSLAASVAAWVRAAGITRGKTPSPQATSWCRAFEEYALAQGWTLTRMPRAMMGQTLVRLGFRRVAVGGRIAYLVSSAAAELLWRYGPAALRPRVRKPPPRVPIATLLPNASRLAHTFRQPKPLRTCDGQTWDSAGHLASALGVSRLAVARALHEGKPVRGVHVAYLSGDWTAKSAKGTVAAHEDDWPIPSPS